MRGAGRGVDPRLDRVQLDREVVAEQPAEVVGTYVSRQVDAAGLHMLAVLVVDVVVDSEQQPTRTHRVEQPSHGGLAGDLGQRRVLHRHEVNQRKLDAVEELAQLAEETGITLIQLAIAFVLNHPAITAALIGPRTMEQLESQLTAADVVLDTAVLDRIDEIVSPGTTLNRADNSFNNPALDPAARRR